MEITIRRATPDDADAISAVWEVVCAERVYTAVNRPFTPQQERDYIASLSDREGVFLAEVEGQVVGLQSLDLWARYTDSFDHVGVMGTIILPQWRGKSIGRRLAEHTFGFARTQGYEKIVIYVRAGNETARAFYRSLGFVPKGVLEQQVKIDGQYEDEVFAAWERTRQIAIALAAPIVLFQCPASFAPKPEHVANLRAFFERVEH